MNVKKHSSLFNGLNLIRNGHYVIFLKELFRRINFTMYTFGLLKNLEEPSASPKANIPITIRDYSPDDFEPLMDFGELAKTAPRLVMNQKGIVDADIASCYVAVTEEGEPAYMQWLMDANQNDKIKDHFSGLFPPLKQNEALLEGAFMRPSYRGHRIMPEAMYRITEKARDLPGVQYVMTFVEIHNIPALKGCRRCGFSPFILRTERWFMFKRTISFTGIPEHLLYNYEQATGDKSKI